MYERAFPSRHLLSRLLPCLPLPSRAVRHKQPKGSLMTLITNTRFWITRRKLTHSPGWHRTPSFHIGLSFGFLTSVLWADGRVLVVWHITSQTTSGWDLVSKSKLISILILSLVLFYLNWNVPTKRGQASSGRENSCSMSGRDKNVGDKNPLPTAKK